MENYRETANVHWNRSRVIWKEDIKNWKKQAKYILTAEIESIRYKAMRKIANTSINAYYDSTEKFDKALAGAKYCQKKHEELHDLYNEEFSKYKAAMEQYRASIKNE